MRNKLLSIIQLNRKKKGLSQKDVAKKLGISAPSYSNLENGKNEITLKRLDEILGVLGIDDEDIIDGKYSQETMEEIIKNQNRIMDLLSDK